MSLRRVSKSAVDWAAFVKKVPPGHEGHFNNLKAKTDAYVSRYLFILNLISFFICVLYIYLLSSFSESFLFPINCHLLILPLTQNASNLIMAKRFLNSQNNRYFYLFVIEIFKTARHLEV